MSPIFMDLTDELFSFTFNFTEADDSGINLNKNETITNDIEEHIGVKDTNVHLVIRGIVSQDVLYWFHVLAFFGINGTISLVGMVANIINMIVFVRQGILSDSSNTTLLGLALVDFWCLLTISMTGVYFLLFQEGPKNLNWDIQEIMLMSTGRPHIMFSQIACWIQAYLALERCVCVSFPFKVKTLFTAKRTLSIVILIYLFTIAAYSPYFVYLPFGWVNIPGTNKTIFRIVAKQNREIVTDILNTLNSIILRMTAIVFVVICTQITVFKINSSKKWRQSVTTVPAVGVDSGQTSNRHHRNDEPNQNSVVSKREHSLKAQGQGRHQKQQSAVSQKDTRMVRMVVTISFIFLVCYTPDIVLVFTRLAVPTLNVGRPHYNLMICCYCVSFFAEAVNSSINIVVYYRMSSRYKEQFRKLFGLETKKK